MKDELVEAEGIINDFVSLMANSAPLAWCA
jgi:hypothetical protein